MAKLSLNKAAKYAGVAKSTILERLDTHDLQRKLSGEKNARGHWEIDEAELDRVFPKTGRVEHVEPSPDRVEGRGKPPSSSALEVEVKMLREQIERMDAERERERSQLTEQIDDLNAQAERQSADHRQALALLAAPEPHKRGFWARFKR